ncbi:phosphoadenosine phosphosulfate sulfotransferase [Achromobacter sp. DMS1]|nr:phosphoadenosine phosphosulfate sulfotransferase [Achromobacter sp. DMS1]
MERRQAKRRIGVGKKTYGQADVLAAARARIRLVFSHFERVCVAFSGGKDSSVTLHLALEAARELGRGPVDVLFIDLEGQYQATIAHVENMFASEDVRPWWICLPINLRNASSMREPYWCAWEPGREADWVRPMPTHPAVISDPARLPFYRYRMEFEEFVPAFNEWLARDVPTAVLVGIRSDESLNRYRAVKLGAKTKKRAWTPPGGEGPVAWSTQDQPASRAITFFPIYDWKFPDIWRYIADHGHPYNRIYDQMHRAGVPFSQMRICQPYGDDQRKGLDLFHRLEPETWFRVVRRVSGANYGARYCRQQFLGYRGGLGLPPTFTSWKQYCQFLLLSMPPVLRQVYQRRIDRFIQWWAAHNYPVDCWPDAGIPALENRKAQPSWRRVGMSLIKSDMARSLSFGYARQDVEPLLATRPGTPR